MITVTSQSWPLALAFTVERLRCHMPLSCGGSCGAEDNLNLEDGSARLQIGAV